MASPVRSEKERPLTYFIIPSDRKGRQKNVKVEVVSRYFTVSLPI